MKTYKKSLSLLSKLLLCAVPISSSVFLLSKSTNKNDLIYVLKQEVKKEEEKEKDKEKTAKDDKKKLDPSFDSFKTEAEKDLKKASEEVFQKISDSIEKELKNIDLDKAESKDYFDLVAKKAYLLALKKVYNDKNDFAKDPSKYGFQITFPYVLANDKKYYSGTIKYNGKEYTNVNIGTQDNRDYSKVINKDKGDEINKANKDPEIDNTVSLHDFKTSVLGSYIAKWKEEAWKMVFNEDEIPKFGEDITLKEKEINGDDSLNLNVVLNSKHGDWKTYILNKVKPKFVDFDLTQNQEFKTEDESQPTPKPNPPSLPDPFKPVLPDDKPSPEININEAIVALPQLQPYVSFRNADEDTNTAINKFKISSTEEEKKEIFFFNNPINTRFEYTVSEVVDGGENNHVKVKITDTVNPSKQRIYTTTIVDPNNNPQWSFLFQKQIEQIQTKFGSFFNALMLDKKLDYKTLGNNDLQTSVIGVVEAANKIFNNEKFKDEWSSINDRYYSSIDISRAEEDENYTPSVVYKTSNAIMNRLLVAMSESILNKRPLWNNLSDSFEAIKNGLEEVSKFEANRQQFIKKAEDFGLDLKYIDKLFENLDVSVRRLKTQANDKLKNLGILNWFTNYIYNIKDTREYVEILRVFFARGEIQKDSEKEKELMDNYNKAISKITNATRSTKNIKIVLGSILLAISLIFTITNTLIFTIKNKNKQNIKKIFTITTLISIFIIAIGITLLVVGIGG